MIQDGVDENIQKTIYNRNIKEFYLSQTEDYSPEDRVSDNSEELLWRRMVLGTVLYLVRTKNIKQVKKTFLQVFKKKKPQKTQTHKRSAPTQ